MVETQECFYYKMFNPCTSVRGPLKQTSLGAPQQNNKVEGYKRNLTCSRKQVNIGCTWVKFRSSHLGGKSSWPSLPKEVTRTFQKTWCPRHVGLPFLDASRKSCSFSLFLRTPNVSYVVLLLSYSYKRKLRNLLACWFKVKLILGQKVHP